MEDLDWGNIPAQQRPEVRRRIAVLQRYVGLANPTKKDRDDAISELGLSRASFYNLVRVWRERGDVQLLQGSGTHRTTTRGTNVDKVAAAFVEVAITNVGARSSTADVHREVIRLSRQAGVTPPSRETVRARHLEVARWIAVTEDATTVVDHCALDLPTEIGGRLVLPVVTAAFLEPEGIIVGYSRSYLPPVCKDTADALLGCLSIHGAERRLTCYRRKEPSWDVFTQLFDSLGLQPPEIPQRRGPGREFRRLAGTNLGGVKLSIQRTLRPAIVRQKNMRTYDAALCDRIVHEAIDSHNRGCGLTRAKDAPQFSIGKATPALRRGLTWIANMPKPLLYAGMAITERDDRADAD